jgi:excisionase family DNA binding protein
MSNDSVKCLLPSEVAEILRVSRARVYELIRTGRLPAIRLGRQVRICEDKLNNLLNAGGFQLAGGWKNNHDSGNG